MATRWVLDNAAFDSALAGEEITLYQLAARSGVYLRKIRSMIRHAIKPSAFVRNHIALALDVEHNDIFTDLND